MNQELSERISALADGESSVRDAGSTLQALTADPESQQTWRRYHLIGDLLRGEGAPSAGVDISGAVHSALAAEPAMIAAPRRGSWLEQAGKRKAAGAAIAASVAALVVVWAPATQQSEPLAPQVAAQPQPSLFEAGSPGGNAALEAADAPQSAAPMRWKGVDPRQVDARIDSYLLDHSEYASGSGIAGLSPYATVVSFESRR